VPVVAAPVVEMPIVRPLPRPSPAPTSAKKSKRAKKAKPQSRTLAPLVGVLAALLGYLGATFEWNAPPAPPKPVVAMVKVEPVVLEVPTALEQTVVERVIVDGPLISSTELASVADPEPFVAEKIAAKPVRKVKKSVRRSREEAPIPPWLVKRSRR
jgi:hypothetical protein